MRPTFAGVDHVALTVTDLDTSQRFYTEVLGFVVVMDVGYGRICMHPQSGFVLTLLAHEGGRGGSFSELNTGVDHIGFTAASREELQEWERHFYARGVVYTPIRNEQFGSHLNFRDPDDIALEFTSSNDLMVAAREALSSGQMTPADIAAFIRENVSPDRRPLPWAFMVCCYLGRLEHGPALTCYWRGWGKGRTVPQGADP